MLDGLYDYIRGTSARLRRIERRELREFRAWLEHTRNLIHLTILVMVPLVLAVVTAMTNSIGLVPFVLFPPLASGTYTLFSDPEGRYASPVRFVAGLTTGAVCGGAAFGISAVVLGTPANGAGVELLQSVSPAATALAIFLTGLATWALDFEEPSAFSTALLALIAPAGVGGSVSLIGGVARYVVGVFVASTVVAAVFSAWRSQFYEQRARYLYTSTKGDDHVLVPMRGDHRDATAMLGARLAAAHDAGKVVLLDIVDDEAVARAEQALLAEGDAIVSDGGPDGPAQTGPIRGSADAGSDGESLDGEAENGGTAVGPSQDSIGDLTDEGDLDAAERTVAESAASLEERADHIQSTVGVPCQVVVAAGEPDDAAMVLRTARETTCDLIVTPYEEARGQLAPFVADLFRGDVDVLVHRSVEGQTRWSHVLVPVRRTGEVAHAMLDFACRLAGSTGRISVCHCLGGTGGRRRAEHMLADLVETFSGTIETRVSRSAIETFLTNEAPGYDLMIIGASRDRSSASRTISPPTFHRINDVDADVAVLDRTH